MEQKAFIWHQSDGSLGSRDAGRSPDRVPAGDVRVFMQKREESEVSCIKEEFIGAG